MAEEKYYVYVIRSETTQKIYIGQTNNLTTRILQHNDPYDTHSKHTKRNRGPWKLVYSEQYASRAEAMRRERALKSGKGREFLKKILSGL